MKREVVICGGGIAGLVTGIRLRQLGGHPLILERQKKIIPQIKGEFFQPAGVELLRLMNLEDKFTTENASRIELVSHTMPAPITHRVLSGAQNRFEFRYDNKNGVNYGIAALHEDILQILRDEYDRLGGEFRAGVAVTDLDAGTKSWTITTQDGEEIRTEALVGADGRYSPTRKMSGLTYTENPCNRVMMAALVRGLHLPQGEFYTEELDDGVLYAFRYPDKTARLYLCFDHSALKEANQNKSDFFFQRVEKSKLFAGSSARLVEPPMMMPTLDAFLKSRSRSTGVWIADAAGSLDPLGGLGMTLGLKDGVEVAEILRANSGKPLMLADALKQYSERSLRRYLQARFIGIWIGHLFMGNNRLARLAKWNTLRRASRDQILNRDMVEFFGGRRDELLGVYDLPYLLGFVPAGLRESLHQNVLNRRFLGLQDILLTSPMELKKNIAKETVARFLEL